MLDNVIHKQQFRIDEQSAEIMAIRTRHGQVEKFGQLKDDISCSPPYNVTSEVKSSYESVVITRGGAGLPSQLLPAEYENTITRLKKRVDELTERLEESD